MTQFEQLQEWARQLEAGEFVLPFYRFAPQNNATQDETRPTELAQALGTKGLTRIPARLWAEIEAHLACEPRTALAFARVLQTLIGPAPRPRLRGRANLALVRALNACAEFRAALDLCEETATLFLNLKDGQAGAQVFQQAAWAETFLGHLETAAHYLALAARAASRRGVGHIEVELKAKWIQARILRAQAQFEQAEHLFQQVHAQFLARGERLNAARCLRELGHTYALVKPPAALEVLVQARQVFDAANCPSESALCDYFTAQALFNLTRFQDALSLLLSSRTCLTEQRLVFFAMLCSNDLGLCYRQLGYLDDGLAQLCPARDYFLRQGADAEASACEINIGTVLEDLNRYDDAFQHYQGASQLARTSGRRRRLALCLNNMGWTRHKQGRYAEALNYYFRARDLFAELGLAYEVAVYADLNCAQAHLSLGQYQRACAQLEVVRAFLSNQDRPGDLAECELYLAEALLNRGQVQGSRAALEHAQQLFAETGQTLFVALCNRLLAQVHGRDGDYAAAHGRLAESRAAFAAVHQPVDVALCDLTEGELLIESGELANAQAVLLQAQRVLGQAFPTHSWRADYGLGRIALAEGKPTQALAHHLDAVHAIADVRAQLIAEQWSNDFFASHQQVYTEALALCTRENAAVAALDVIEAAKARAFVAYLTRREWKRGPWSPASEEVEQLARQESELRYKLAGWRNRRAAHAIRRNSIERGGEGPDSLDAAEWQELKALGEQYEAVVTRLRLHNTGLAGAPTLAPFDLDAFRAAACARWGSQWAALDYYYDEDTLTLVHVSPDDVKVHRPVLPRYDRYVLDQCTATALDLRQYIYNPVPHGTRAAPSADLLNRVAVHLIPDELYQKDGVTLLISPHRRLHQLPFHALMDGDTFLVERFNVIYTPALQAWMQSNAAPSVDPVGRLLVCGLDEFGGRAGPLKHTAEEVAMLEQLFAGRATSLWGGALRRSTLRDWNARGALRSFAYLHWATHAVTDPLAPHSSRILLADDDLMVTDVLDLILDARLVTLSACSSAGIAGGAGDEMIALARAFFYAGARALVASLWAVDDQSAAGLMQRFYEQLIQGVGIAAALRAAQLEMLRENSTPFYWAPFVAIGDA